MQRLSIHCLSNDSNMERRVVDNHSSSLLLIIFLLREVAKVVQTKSPIYHGGIVEGEGMAERGGSPMAP